VLNARYGAEHQERVRMMVEQSGYAYNPPPELVPNSRMALELTELARDRGLHEEVHLRLMRAYWSEAADIGDQATLVGLVQEVGLDPGEASEALEDRRYGERVTASTRRANSHGINAIPAFVLDERLLVMGAQPHELFEQAFVRLESSED
jgi:predicted DsbA family dithiol-disulfide isomerase